MSYQELAESYAVLAMAKMKDEARIRELEAQVEKLKQELEWEQEAHAKTAQYYGETPYYREEGK